MGVLVPLVYMHVFDLGVANISLPTGTLVGLLTI